MHTDVGLISTGWFKAPETGRYRFYISCDDSCKLFLDSTNKFDKSSPTEPVLVEVANRNTATEWRNYFVPPKVDSTDKHITDWIDLTTGEFYFIEGYAMESNETDHFTVSVEFEKASATGHHHARKEVQVLKIDQTNVAEQFQITVNGAAGVGDMIVQFLNPKNDENGVWQVKWWQSEPMADNVSAETMKTNIEAFFKHDWDSTIDVAKVDYDADAQVTVDPALTTRSIYTVSIRRRNSKQAFTIAAVLPNGLTSIVETSQITVQSSAPLSGNFVVVCTDD